MGSKFNAFAVGVVAGLAVVAVGQELTKAPDQREWKGTVGGVPYNFRLDEWPEIANEYWNPESGHILVPHAIGLGWGVNFAALVTRARALLGVGAPASPDTTAATAARDAETAEATETAPTRP